MLNPRTAAAIVLLLVLPFVACESDSEPSCVAVDASGVWDVVLTGESGSGIVCPDVTRTWTLLSNRCEITIVAEDPDPADGAAGSIEGDRLYVEWTWVEGCYRYHETIDARVDGDIMTGVYYLGRSQEVYPGYCPGLGLCKAVVAGARRPY